MRKYFFIYVLLYMFLPVNVSAVTDNKTTTASEASLSCARRSRLYIPIQSVAPNTGIAASDRKSFMDKKYESVTWIVAPRSGVVIRDTAMTEKSVNPVAITISTDKPEFNYTRATVILETRLDYSEDVSKPGYRYRYKQLAEYALEKNTVVELLVPPTAIKGPGAILVTLSREGTKVIDLVAQPVSYDRCIEQIYVKDRRTAIRLNRGK